MCHVILNASQTIYYCQFNIFMTFLSDGFYLTDSLSRGRDRLLCRSRYGSLDYVGEMAATNMVRSCVCVCVWGGGGAVGGGEGCQICCLKGITSIKYMMKVLPRL